MREAYAATGQTTNSRGAGTGVDFSVLGIGLNAKLSSARSSRSRTPRKTWGFLCDLLQDISKIEMTERVAKHRLAGTRDYTVEELQALLQSDEGIDFLVALMADAEPKWWWWGRARCSPATRF